MRDQTPSSRRLPPKGARWWRLPASVTYSPSRSFRAYYRSAVERRPSASTEPTRGGEAQGPGSQAVPTKVHRVPGPGPVRSGRPEGSSRDAANPHRSASSTIDSTSAPVSTGRHFRTPATACRPRRKSSRRMNSRVASVIASTNRPQLRPAGGRAPGLRSRIESPRSSVWPWRRVGRRSPGAVGSPRTGPHRRCPGRSRPNSPRPR
jgi:hypothetical protein